MKHRRWFLPESPDLLGHLRRQMDLARDGFAALADWAAGDAARGADVRAAERASDEARRELLALLEEALVTPIDAEDVFTLSREIDRALDHAKDLVRESEVLAILPDKGTEAMCVHIRAGAELLDESLASLEANDRVAASGKAQQARHELRQIEHAYRKSMRSLLQESDLRLVMASAELHRRCEYLGETLIDVAERVVYAIVKER